MRISFDLDDTLICCDPTVPCEPNRVPLWWRARYSEPLRLGTVSLMTDLMRQGHSLWIYTTSYRAPAQVKRWLKFYGIALDGVINQEMHERCAGCDRYAPPVSKHPPAFGIDLHVDDLAGVALEGAARGFEVVVVRPDDTAWTQQVREAVAQWEPLS